jgi:hypothetical protein
LRDEFAVSASNNLIAPTAVILIPWGENEVKVQGLVPMRWREVRDEFNLSASDNSLAPSLLIPLSVF